MNSESNIPALEERFLQPAGWRWHIFKSGGCNIRFGTVFPKNPPRAIVVILPGLGEFCEKYYELAHDLLSHDFAVWILDWPDQGYSDRLLPNKGRRHSLGFQRDINALHNLYTNYIKHAGMHPEIGRIPCVMLGHSMGCNIGLRYLFQHPETFKCAFFSAPMFGIKTFESVPTLLALAVTALGSLFNGTGYAPGQKPWDEHMRTPGHDIYSSDEKRGALQMQWCKSNEKLRIGGVTWRWLYEAVLSCLRLQNSRLLKLVKTPIAIALAEKDALVDNRAASKVAKTVPHAQIFTANDALHEILMERDDIRGPVLKAFYAFIQKHIMVASENLKNSE